MTEGYSFRGTGAAVADGWTLSAHAAVTGVDYGVLDEYGEFVEHLHPGTFRDTLSRGPDVHLLANHTGLSLARTRSGTLRLAEDDRGLRYTGDLDPASPNAQALRSAVQRGDISESSFAFKVTRQEWSDDFQRRDIFAVDIDGGDVSACNFGANKSTGEPGSATTFRSQAASGEQRKQLSTAEMNDLPDSAFAYIQPGGKLDSSGKTVPRSYRHFCIVDAAHVRNALARIGQGAAFGKQALPAVLKAAKKFGVHAAQANAAGRVLSKRSSTFVGCACCPPCVGAPSDAEPCDGSCCAACNPAALKAAQAALANADIASGSLDTPSSEFLSALHAAELGLPDYSLEVRLAILRLRARGSVPLTATEQATVSATTADRIIANALRKDRR
jgi:HK97 family phage prohead protease